MSLIFTITLQVRIEGSLQGMDHDGYSIWSEYKIQGLSYAV